jgi:hypothetical protein
VQPSRALLVRKAHALFGADAGEVLALLDAYPGPGETGRVKLAIKLSEGRLDRLRAAIETARTG